MSSATRCVRIYSFDRILFALLTLSLICVYCLCFIPHKHPFSFRVYGHRGARSLAPENTIEAYQLALIIGVDVVDMDINMSQDGVLMVTHDTTLNPDITRDENGMWVTHHTPIKSLTVKQLQRYNVGKINPRSPYHRLFHSQHALAFAKIPTLEEAIQFVKTHQKKPTHFQIEIKSSPDEPELSFPPDVLAKALSEVLRRENIADITEVQSFDFRCLIALHKIAPHIRTAYLTDESERQMTEKALSKWLAGYHLENYHHSFPELIAAIGGTLWEPQDSMLTKSELDHAHALGLEVVVWSDPVKTHHNFTHEQLVKLDRWGVNGVILDDPRIRG